MPLPGKNTALDPKALEEAADWLVRLAECELSDGERAEWEQWKTSNPDRERAWARAQLLQDRVGGVSPVLAMSVLDRPHSPERRATVIKLALLLAALPACWGSWELSRRQQWTADYRSAVGERRTLTLADGSQVTLNTDTAIDVLFNADQRLIRLRSGEIMVQTAADPSPRARPFLVTTAKGSMQALGTRFCVHDRPQHTRLAVFEGAVKVVLADNRSTPPKVISAGQRTDFSSDAFGQVSVADPYAGAWTQGMFMADKMRLADFAAELSRYRHGFIRCDPAVAELRVSGAYPISDTSRTLNMLARTYRIKLTGHLGGYWMTLSPA